MTSLNLGVGLQKAGFGTGSLKAGISDKSLREEREMIDRDGQRKPGFAGSVIPTVEEQVVAEHQAEMTDKQKMGTVHEEGEDETQAEAGGAPDAAGDDPNSAGRVKDGSGEKYGAPADASKDITTDDEPPHVGQNGTAADAAEKAAIPARESLRRHLSNSADAKESSLPTPKAAGVDPNGFEDPLVDTFYKDVWMKTAVRNVGFFPCIRLTVLASNLSHRRRSIVKSSIRFPMTWSPHGSNTRSLCLSKSDLPNPFVRLNLLAMTVTDLMPV